MNEAPTTATKVVFFFFQTSVTSTSPPRSACVFFCLFKWTRDKKKCSSSPSHPRFFLYMYNYVYVCIIVKMPATTTRVKVKKQNLRSGERCFKKEKNTKSCRQLYKRYKVKCQQKHTPIQRVFSGESGAKVMCLKGDRLMLFGMCIPPRLSLSKSEQSRFLCVCVYTTWKYKFFQGPLPPPKMPIFFFLRRRKKHASMKRMCERKKTQNIY